MTELRPFDGAETQERITRFLRETRLAPEDAPIVPLTGDASDRRYVRVVMNGQPSIVLALHTGPIAFTALPFANVAELLHQMPIAAPRILGHSDRDGILALTDLGDMTLQAHLAMSNGANRGTLYRGAIDLIGVLQRRGEELATDRYVPYRTVFDVDKLTWELDFFCRHFLEGHRQRVLSSDAREELSESWRDIVEELAAESRVLCHRDYHSRNLMLHEGQLHLIDFQDARLGPDTYDLASLLRDSYVELTNEEVDELVAYFLEVKGLGRSASEFRRRFDLMSLQRNLKALGTFGYQAATRQNSVYLQYVPRTLGYVRANLEKYDRFSRLRTVLSEHIEELR